MLIKNVDVNELYELTKEMTLDCSRWEGFAFFSSYCSGNYYNDNADFIVAIEDNKIIGIIKYSIKICQAITDFNFELKRDEIYTSMHYIDVNKDHKGKGIGSKLIEFFNTIIDKSVPLLISEEWGEGKTVGTHRMFKKYIRDTDMVFHTPYGYQRENSLNSIYNELYV